MRSKVLSTLVFASCAQTCIWASILGGCSGTTKDVDLATRRAPSSFPAGSRASRTHGPNVPVAVRCLFRARAVLVGYSPYFPSREHIYFFRIIHRKSQRNLGGMHCRGCESCRRYGRPRGPPRRRRRQGGRPYRETGGRKARTRGNHAKAHLLFRARVMQCSKSLTGEGFSEIAS